MPPIRILIIEDDPDIASLVESSLGGDLEYLHAANGLEGLQMALEGQPDLILSDIMMPGVDGYEFVRRLRAKPGFEKVPVVFLSALGSKEQIRQGYDLGAALYLTKPIDPVRLKRNIDLFIEDHAIQGRPKARPADEVQDNFGSLSTPSVSPPGAASGSAPTPPASPASGAAPIAPEAMQSSGSPSPAPGPHSEPAPAPPDEPAPASSEAQRPRILIVTDSTKQSEEIKASLPPDYEVVLAADGMEAIERAVRYLPDIFIVDGTLPKMTGYQLVSMLKKNKIFRDHPIVMISEKATSRDRQYVRRIGVEHFLPKPLNADDLRESIRDIVSSGAFSVAKERVGARQMKLESLRDFEKRR